MKYTVIIEEGSKKKTEQLYINTQFLMIFFNEIKILNQHTIEIRLARKKDITVFKYKLLNLFICNSPLL